MKLHRIPGLLVAWSALAFSPVLGQSDTDALADAARATVKAAWEREVKPLSESALTRIEIHAVERRNRLARGVYLVHAFAEASWWKHSRQYVLLMRAAEADFEVLYRYDGGTGGKGIEYRLVDVGSATRRAGLEISDHGFDDDTTGTWTILTLFMPASDRFSEVFRELTTYRPVSSHGYASTVSHQPADGPMKNIVVSTQLFKNNRAVDQVETTFVWQASAYQGTMPLPDAWRSELPATLKRQAPAPKPPTAKPDEHPPTPQQESNPTPGETHG